MMIYRSSQIRPVNKNKLFVSCRISIKNIKLKFTSILSSASKLSNCCLSLALKLTDKAIHVLQWFIKKSYTHKIDIKLKTAALKSKSNMYS